MDARRASSRERAAAVVLQCHVRSFLERNHLLRGVISERMTQVHALLALQRSRRQLQRSAAVAPRILSEASTVKSYKKIMYSQRAATTSKMHSLAQSLPLLSNQEKNFNVIKLQAQLRRYLSCVSHNRQIGHAIKIQAHIRHHLTRRVVSQLKGIIKVQAHLRRYLARREVCKSKGIIRAQAHSRRYLTRREVRKQRNAIKLQAKLRRLLTRKNLRPLVDPPQNERLDAIILQKHARCYIITRQYRRQRAFSIQLQTLMRRYLTKKVFESRRDRWRKASAARTLQAIGRHYLRRKEIKKLIKLQALARKYLILKLGLHQSLRYDESVLKVQRLIRLYLTKKFYALRKKDHLEHRASLCLQRYLRLSYAKKIQTTMIIQSLVRCYLAKARSFTLLQAVIKIQAKSRGLIARWRYRDRVSALHQSQANQNAARLLKPVTSVPCIPVTEVIIEQGEEKLKVESSCLVVSKPAKSLLIAESVPEVNSPHEIAPKLATTPKRKPKLAVGNAASAAMLLRELSKLKMSVNSLESSFETLSTSQVSLSKERCPPKSDVGILRLALDSRQPRTLIIALSRLDSSLISRLVPAELNRLLRVLAAISSGKTAVRYAPYALPWIFHAVTSDGRILLDTSAAAVKTRNRLSRAMRDIGNQQPASDAAKVAKALHSRILSSEQAGRV